MSFFRCPFLKPAKKTKNESPVDIKVCNAFVPSIEIDEEQTLCKICDVPKTLKKGKACIFLAPLDFDNGQVRYLCKKLQKKYVQPKMCNSRNCIHFSL